MTKSNLILVVSLIFLVALPESGGAFGLEVGAAFGAPSLLALRGVLSDENSPWQVQADFSRMVMQKNRGDGEILVFRLDVQRRLDFWNSLLPFYFGGLSYYEGYATRDATRFSLSSLEGGVGVALPITEKLTLTTEGGVILPTQTVKGFEHAGIIFNVGVLWTMDWPKIIDSKRSATKVQPEVEPEVRPTVGSDRDCTACQCVECEQPTIKSENQKISH